MAAIKGTNSSLCSFIKGYLPVRLRLLSQHQHEQMLYNDADEDDEEEHESESNQNDKERTDDPIDETYFYIKEHTGTGSESKPQNDGGKGTAATLFVANCPTIPNVSTKLLLQSIFGRYGDVSRVTVIPKPASSNRMSSFTEVPNVNEPYRWTDRYAMVPSYFKQDAHGNTIEISDCEGKFAHVVFSSPKEMKRTFRTIHEIMSTPATTTTTVTKVTPAILLEPIEIQTLMDESDRKWREHYKQQSPLGHDNDHDDNESETDETLQQLSAVQFVAQQYRTNCQRYMNRNALMEECNRIMELYEDEETAAERRRKEMTQQPDEDGFITVSYHPTTVSTTTTNDLEQTSQKHSDHNNHKRTRAVSDGIAIGGTGNSKRTRNNKIKKKKGLQLGSLPIPDFYRFQTRQQQQNSISELRQRFEQDKIRIFQKTNHK